MLAWYSISTLECYIVTLIFWSQLNSNGGRLISPVSESAINIPAIAAALVTKAYHAKDYDELELKVGYQVVVVLLYSC